MFDSKMKSFWAILCFLNLLFLAKSQLLKLRIGVNDFGLEGKNLDYTFAVISGTPSCNLKIFKPDGSLIKETTVTMPISIASYSLPASDIGDITENIILTSKFLCTEGISSVSLEFRTEIYALENNAGSSTLPAINFYKVAVSNIQETQVTIYAIKASGTTSCSFGVTEPNKATLSTTGPITIPSNNHEIIATRVGSSDSAIVKATCTTSSPTRTFISYFPVYFTPDSDPWPSASGDPHFNQIVLDTASSTTKSICYDVTGSPGDYLHIAGFSLSGIQIFGQLKDDYYMHKAFIKSAFGNITISTNYIILDNQKVMEWNDNSKSLLFQTNVFEYKLFNNQIYISTLKQHSPLIIRIEKSTHSLAEKHLDVSFKLLQKDYKDMSGLIGDIGKKKYIFNTEVQTEDSNGSKIISIITGNNLIRGRKVDRANDQCWLVNIDDLLKPYKITSYLHKNI